MIDFFHLPDGSINTQIFYTINTNLTRFETWNKPKNCKFISVFCLGSGSGGGGATAGASNTARRGGGGGGSGAYSKGLFQASCLPDTLYVSVGKGGAGGLGGASAGNGGAGTLSYVTLLPSLTGNYTFVMQSGDVAPTSGGGGGSGTGGTGGTVWTGSFLSKWGIVNSVAGQNGASSTISLAGFDITVGKIVSGGASGSATSTTNSFAGGSILASGFFKGVTGGALGGVGIAEVGGNGYESGLISPNSLSRLPMFFTGGAGGGSSVSSTGGAGGNASFGSGGGGGGAGITSFAGAGGDGGDGLVIITCW